METLGQAIAAAFSGERSFDDELTTLTPDEAEKKLLFLKCESYNEREGSLTGYDCALCKNRGQSLRVRENESGGFEVVCVPCRCLATRDSIARLRKSGLERVTKLYTFKKFETPEPWQDNIKRMAVEYVQSLDAGETDWFFIGGQTGAGKTHICSAIAVQAIKQGKNTRYMLWRDELRRLKALANTPEYGDAIRQWQEVQVLYIDDFLKAGRGQDGRMNPTQSDIMIAFELLNYRYVNGGATIISSEMTINEIASIDEATAGRIAQKSNGFCLTITRGSERNYRLKGVING